MEIVKGHCNKCNGERRQEVLRREHSRWEHEEVAISGSDTYEMLKCCGCEAISLRHSSWFSEDCGPDGEPIENVRYYPPAIFRQKPEWLYQLSLNAPVHDLLKEIYVALQNDCCRLAAMGVRALLEYVMVQKVEDQGSFKKNLAAFEGKGFISKKQSAVMESVLEIGHATMHRAYKPSFDNLVTLMNITENIIESIYINHIQLSEISDDIPPRATMVKGEE